MAGKLLFTMLIAAGISYAQEAPPKADENPSRAEMREKSAPARKCSVPLINVRPAITARMPMIQPRNQFVPKPFFIDPPAPPCEDESRFPVISNAAPEKKEARQAK